MGGRFDIDGDLEVDNPTIRSEQGHLSHRMGTGMDILSSVCIPTLPVDSEYCDNPHYRGDGTGLYNRCPGNGVYEERWVGIDKLKYYIDKFCTENSLKFDNKSVICYRAKETTVHVEFSIIK